MTKAEATRKYGVRKAFMGLRRNPNKEKKTHRGLSIVWTAWDYIDEAAWDTNRSRSWVICEIVRDYIAMLDAEFKRSRAGKRKIG